MILLDSDMIIYAQRKQSGMPSLLQLSERLATCHVVMAEVLGYPKLDAPDEAVLRRLFASMVNLPFDDAVMERTILLRRARPIKLPDAVIAASAIEAGATLWSRNEADFGGIVALRLYDPFIPSDE